ncbi:MAG: porin [Acidobacteria bacterium]|nr:porin [Acidobacteriota bacterium]
MIRHLNTRSVLIAAIAVAMLVAPTARAFAGNEAMLKLLRILRDRGSITPQEYEELRLAAEQPEAAPAPTVAAGTPRTATAPPGAPALPAITTSDALATRVQALEAQVATQDTEMVRKALANKWYERIGLRGYTQFRVSTAGDPESGPAVEVPADRSVNENESFVIRRGRFVFSGEATDRLSLYAQMDFNGSTGAADYALQMRDLYADIALDRARAFRVRLGQSKVPFGWVNLQSSQNRAAFERPEAINSAVEGERDYGAYLMWASPEARRRFRDLVGQGLKGSGDYGVLAVGAFNGHGLNRSDANGDPHWVARASYPFRLASGQYAELGVQAYKGRFVPATTAITADGATITPVRDAGGLTDERVGLTAVWYPQPFGVEAEWNVGRGPELGDDLRTIDVRSLHGGYVQASYRRTGTALGVVFPFVRWNYYDGGRKFARNAPHLKVNEVDVGLEMAKWSEVELAMVYTRTFTRTRTSAFPYTEAKGINRLGVQVQWNY